MTDSKIPLDVMKPCNLCGKIITDSVYVTFKDKISHKECFKCSKCGKLLDGQEFQVESDKLYCIDDYKKYFCKHCAVCGEALIGKFYPCGDKFYHDKCFVCKDCGKSVVSGYKESPPDADHDVGIFCPDHYYEHFGEICTACGKRCHAQVEILRDYKYHPECFSCCVCKKHLENGEFKVQFSEDNQPPKIYCTEHCGELVAPKCCGCKKPLEGSYVTANGSTYHHECFKCEKCGNVIEKSYAIVDGKVCCPNCK